MMYYIDLSDNRMSVLKKLLEPKFKTAEFSFEEAKKLKLGDALIFSPAKKFNEEEVHKLPSNIMLYAGATLEAFTPILAAKNITYHNLLKDEIFTVKNANLTCEGVLALILNSSNKSIYDNNILILGGGRIAKGLTSLFTKLGATFSLVSFNKIKFPEYYIYSKNCYFGYSFLKDISTFDIIVNTIPATIIDDTVITKIAPNTIFIEVASVNCLNKAKVKNFTYLEAPGLPQKYSAYTAGKLMYETITGENNYDK